VHPTGDLFLRTSLRIGELYQQIAASRMDLD
jgi:hypothetical protein